MHIFTFIEHREMVASLLTLYGGLIFVQKDSKLEGVAIFFFVIVIIFNIRFLQ